MQRSKVQERVVLVEDDPRFAAAVAKLLESVPTFSVAGSFRTGEEAVNASLQAAVPWHWALVDLGLPGIDGIETTRRLLQQRPSLQVVMVTVYDQPNRVAEAILAGATGYVTKADSSKDLIELLGVLRSGGALLTPSVARALAEAVLPAQASQTEGPLSKQEVAVLRGLANGHSYKTLGVDLGLSIDTIRTHVRHLYGKLHVHSAAEAVARGFELKLL